MPALLIKLILILGIARLVGSLAERLGQPRVIGELLTGFALGSAWLGLISPDDALRTLSDLGVIFMMYLAGLHMRPKELLEISVPGFVVASCGAFLPLAMGFGLAQWWGFGFVHSLFVGVGLSITAVAVNARILMELDGIGSRAGRIIMAAAVLDDVIGLVFFAILSSMASTGSPPAGIHLAYILARIMFFFGLAVVIGFLLPSLVPQVKRMEGSTDALFTFCLLVSFSFAFVAEEFGLHPMIGAYIAGLLVNSLSMRGVDTKRVAALFSPFALGFLGPLFFVYIGLEVDASALAGNATFVLAIVAAAILGKVVGCGGASRLMGSSWSEAAIIGAGMNGRGAVELIVAEFGRRLPGEPLPDVLFSTLVVMAFVTTLLTPVALKLLLPRYRRELARAKAAARHERQEPPRRLGR
jgi:Kef-type K+ transport system membrane component KefB